MKKLPLGIQSIVSVIRGGYVYVDKTKCAERLISQGKFYFLARPRRFGKSLFLSTLEHIFLGNRTLFEGCQIAQGAYNWKTYPVVYLDLSLLRTTSTADLEKDLQRRLVYIAGNYAIKLKTTEAVPSLVQLIESLSKKYRKGVVVLVDEYDKPLVDNLSNPELFASNRLFMKNFFGVLKGLDQNLHFMFVTGVSKFSQVTLFSEMNNLEDISLDPNYADVCGYTELEIQTTFSEHIDLIEKERRISSQETRAKGPLTTQKSILAEMKEWYNGYRFSSKPVLVYNPHSILNFLKTGEIKSYWFSTGTPSLLMEEIKKGGLESTKKVSCQGSFLEKKERPSIYDVIVQKVALPESTLLDANATGDLDVVALMWQTGYLTFKECIQPKSRASSVTHASYILDFPNREIKISFYECLVRDVFYINPAVLVQNVTECRKSLYNEDFKSFFEILNLYFAKIPHPIFLNVEAGYHMKMIAFLTSMGFDIHTEVSTSRGRIDLVIDTHRKVYIFELKLNRSSTVAMEQIQEKEYINGFLRQDKEIVAVGVSFHSEHRQVGNCEGLVYSAKGDIIRNIPRISFVPDKLEEPSDENKGTGKVD